MVNSIILLYAVTVRFCAVFGGVYVLKRSVASLLLDENKSVPFTAVSPCHASSCMYLFTVVVLRGLCAVLAKESTVGMY